MAIPSTQDWKNSGVFTFSRSWNQAWASPGPDSIIGDEASQAWSSPMRSQSRGIKLMVWARIIQAQGGTSRVTSHYTYYFPYPSY